MSWFTFERARSQMSYRKVSAYHPFGPTNKFKNAKISKCIRIDRVLCQQISTESKEYTRADQSLKTHKKKPLHINEEEADAKTSVPIN